MNDEQDEIQYAEPVKALLSLGEPEFGNFWEDYSKLGLGPEHVEELARMSSDNELHNSPMEEDPYWAPVHAWRALGQLGGDRALAPLLNLLKDFGDSDDDYVEIDLPKAIGLIGPSTIQPLLEFIENPDTDSEAIRLAISALGQIGENHPDARSSVTEFLIAEFRRFARNRVEYNCALLDELAKLRVVEAGPLIEQAYIGIHVDFEYFPWSELVEELGYTEAKPENVELIESLEDLREELLQQVREEGGSKHLKKVKNKPKKKKKKKH